MVRATLDTPIIVRMVEAPEFYRILQTLEAERAREEEQIADQEF